MIQLQWRKIFERYGNENDIKGKVLVLERGDKWFPLGFSVGTIMFLVYIIYMKDKIGTKSY